MMVVFRPDPCGIICILFTYVAVVYADYVVINYLVLPSMSESLLGALNTVVFNIIIFLLLASHLRAVLSDPGIVPLPPVRLDFSDMHSGRAGIGAGGVGVSGVGRDSISSAEGDGGAGMAGEWSACRRCETYRPPRAHHCRVCKRCVRRMDHHCPWINNCVGEFNQKYFLQFLAYTGLASVYALLLVALSWFAFDCGECDTYHEYKQTRVIHSIVLTVESILFGVFVIAIICDQLSAIYSDESPIDNLKRTTTANNNYGNAGRVTRSKMDLLSDVFGRHNNKWFWLCPFQSGPASPRHSTSLCRRSSGVRPDMSSGPYMV